MQLFVYNLLSAICNTDTASPYRYCLCNLQQKDVDKEFFLLFSVMDENMSWYLDENILKFGSSETNQNDEDFEESNMMHGNLCVPSLPFLTYFHTGPCVILCNPLCIIIAAVNGRMYGNLLGLEMCAGDKVSWYTLGLGTEVDLHGVYFEGNTFKRQSTTRDTVNLFPHTTATGAMQPNTPG